MVTVVIFWLENKGETTLGRTANKSEDFFSDDLSDVICFTIGEKKEFV